MDRQYSPQIRVLVVEDDAAIREMTVLLLETQGYATASAANGQAALDYLYHHALPHCMLLDVEMPVMNGSTFRRVQQSDPRLAHIPVIVLSAGRQSEETIAQLQPTAWLHKPFDPPELLAILADMCGDPTTSGR